MMNQETYVKVHDLRKQGWTIGEIAAETGFHPETISIQLKSDEPPTRRRVPDTALVMNARWKQRIEGLIGTYPRLLGISVHNKLHAEGFTGGYSTVTRELRTIRGPRFRAADAASMPIHTDPGEEAQFDFCDLSDWARRWGWPTPLWCFGMILCWSRWRMWWFTTSEDRQHTFEGIARFFDTAGGIPAANRTDRMGALGRSQVHNIVPFISIDGGRYSVPPDVLGQLVEVRRAVDATEFTVRWAGNVVVTHQLASEPGNEIVWDPAHRAATERIALTGRPRTGGRHLHLVASAPIDIDQLQLHLGDGDFDVDTPDLDTRYNIGGEPS